MDNIIECDFWCVAPGTERADELGTDRPPQVRRRGVLRLDHVVAYNESIDGDPGVWVYFSDKECLNAALTFDEFHAAYMRYMSSERITRSRSN
jgi:hypothetical protein